MKNYLRYYRKCCDLTQTELAVKSGLSQVTISAIECGTWSPTLQNALKISKVLGIPINELFELERTD